MLCLILVSLQPGTYENQSGILNFADLMKV